MEYKFWGWEQANVPAVINQYKGIRTPLDLYDALFRNLVRRYLRTENETELDTGK